MATSRLRMCALVALFCIAPARGSQVRPLNLEDMAQRADRIFWGQCIDVRFESDPELGQPVTVLTFSPRRGVKGADRGPITVRLLGEGGLMHGLSPFREGEEVVLFLYSDSARGLTSPVGFGQGRFSVLEGKRGGPIAVNAFDNDNLFRGLSGEARQRLGPAAERWHGAGALPVDALLDLAGSLAEPPRGQ